MEHRTTRKGRSLQYGSVIKSLSIVALVCAILGCILNITPLGVNFLIFNGIPVLVSILLFVLYIFKFYNKGKGKIIIPIIFGLFLPITFLFVNFVPMAFDYSRSIPLMLFLLTSICSILSIISALKGFNNKTVITLAIAGCLIMAMLSLIGIFDVIEYLCKDNGVNPSNAITNYPEYYGELASIASMILLDVALLLFCLYNRITPAVALSPAKERAIMRSMNPEQALQLLNDKLELGIITEEEYQVQRAKIIDNL